MKFQKIISMLIIMIMLFSCTSISFAETEQNDNKNLISTSFGPEGYVPHDKKINNVKLFDADSSAASVLLLESTLPWDTVSNQNILNSMTDVSYTKTSLAEALSYDFYKYDLIVVANDQTSNTYSDYINLKAAMEEYVFNGGTILFGACDQGWGGNGFLSEELPGGVQKVEDWANNNYIYDENHYIVTSTSLKNSDLYGDWCSHSSFEESTLPASSNVIIRSSVTDNPTLVEYAYGQGTVIASGLTWEYYYDSYNTFSNKAYKPLYEYALSLASGVSRNIYNTATNTISVTVYENTKNPDNLVADYRISKDAEISNASNTYKTGSNGIATIPHSISGNVTVSKLGYIPVTVSAAILNESKKVYLEKDSGKGPVVTSVMIDKTNLLVEEYEIDLNDKAPVIIRPNINWRNNEKSSVSLVQNSTIKMIDDDSLKIVLSDYFNVNEDIYIVATDNKGFSTKKKLNFVESGNVPDCLNGMKISFNSKINLTLPESFPLIGGSNISAGLDKAITDAIPVQISVDENKIYVSIGIDIVEYSKSDNYATSKASGNRAHVLKRETQTAVDKIKDLFDATKKGGSASTAAKKLKNLKQTYKNAMKYPKGSFGFSADFTFLGFAEGYIDSNGTPCFTSSGIILNPSIDLGWSGQFALGPVPMYWEAAIAADIEAKANLYQNVAMKNFIPEGEVSGDVGGSVGIGAGINKVLSVGGGGGITFNPLWQIKFNSNDYFKLDGSLNAYFKVVVGWLEYKKQWDTPKKTLLEYPKAKLSAAEDAAEMFDLYNLDNYSIQDRSYTSKPSEFAANKSVNLFGYEDNTAVTFKDNVYTYSAPQLVTVGDDLGTMLAVWIEDDTDRSAVNRTSLAYSYYDGATWNEPKYVEDDGTADFSPNLKVVNGTAYLVWQNGNAVFSESDAVETICAGMEITSAEFNVETQCFENITDLSNNSVLDYMPEIYSEDGTSPAALWIQNSDNDFFSVTNTNSIMTSELTEGTDYALYTDLSSIGALSGSLYGDVAFHLDTDGDLNTISDKEIYLNGEIVSDPETADLNPVFDNYGNLYYYCDGKLVTLDAALEQHVICDNMPTDNFTLVSSYFDDSMAIVYELSNGLESNMYALMYSPECGWGNQIKLTDENKFLHGYGIVLNGDNSITILSNETEIIGDASSENPFGETDLVLHSENNTTNITITDVLYNTETLVRGSNCYFDIILKNNSNHPLTGFNVLLDDGIDTTYQSFTDTVASGATCTLRAVYAVPSDFVAKNLEISVECDEEENDISDNSYTAELSYEDISIENMNYGFDSTGQAYISADVVNRGYGNGSDIVVELRSGSYDGEIVETKEISVEDLFDCENVTFEIDAKDGDIFYISVESDDDVSTNNNEYVVIDNKDYVIKDGCVTITRYSNLSAESIVIPESINGYPVTQIGDGAFSGSDATTITIPSSVTKIGSEAFSYCESLTEIILPNGIESIGLDAFKGCSSLSSLKCNGSVYYDKNGILYKNTETGCELIYYPAKSTATTYIQEEDVTGIAVGAFDDAIYLKEIVLNEKVTSLNTNMFMSCTSLEKLELPFLGTNPENSVPIGYFFGGGMDYYNSNAVLPETLKKLVIHNKNDESIAAYAMYGCQYIEEIEVGGGSIGYYAFSYCPMLTKLTLSYKCMNMEYFQPENDAFTVYIYENSVADLFAEENGYKVEYIGITPDECFITEKFADYYTWSLSYGGKVTIDGIGAMPTENYPWKNYSNFVQSAEITGLVTSIGYNAFCDMYKLKSVTMCESVKRIDSYAFSGCYGLESINLSDNIHNIGSYAFYNCGSLSGSLVLPEGLMTIGESTFNSCGFTEIVLPDSLKYIDEYAFYDCVELSDINLPIGLVKIGYSAFEYTNITEFNVPYTVVSIGSYAFGSAYDEITINGYENSFVNSFADQHGITFVAYDEEMPHEIFLSGTIDDDFSYELYYSGALYIKGAGAMPDNIEYPWFGYDKTGTYLADYITHIDIASGITKIGSKAFESLGNLKSVSLPESVHTISYAAFCDCQKLENINLPQNIKTIANDAFSYCESLSGTLTIPGNVTKIGNNAFTGTGYTSVILPDGITTIPENAFSNCEKLSSIYIPSNVITIEYLAFGNCPELKAVTIPYKTSYIDRNAFYETSSNDGFTIYGYKDSYAEDYANALSIMFEASLGEIPDGTAFSGTCGDDYTWTIDFLGNLYIDGIGAMPTQYGYEWQVYSTNVRSVEFGPYVTSIASNAFKNMPNLRKIVFNDKITKIGDYAFDSNYMLESVILPESVVQIGYGAFGGCQNLEYIAILNNETAIEDYAFDNCQKLDTIYYAGSEEEWNDIIYTDELNDIVIFNSNGPTGYKDFKYSVSTNNVAEVTVRKRGMEDNDTLFLATYNGDVFKRVIQHKITESQDSYVSAKIEFDDGDTLKAFVWDENLAPYLESFSTICKNEVIIYDSLESPHDYYSSMNEYYTYTYNGDCASMTATFSSLSQLESSYDSIYIYDKDDNLIATFTGTEIANAVVEIPGNTIKINLVTDGSVTYYGFKIDTLKINFQ